MVVDESLTLYLSVKVRLGRRCVASPCVADVLKNSEEPRRLLGLATLKFDKLGDGTRSPGVCRERRRLRLESGCSLQFSSEAGLLEAEFTARGETADGSVGLGKPAD